MKVVKIITRLFLFLPILFVSSLWAHSSLPDLIEEAHQRDLSHQPAWERLLHVRKGFLWGQKSDIDGASFFLSPHGRTNVQDELDATLTAFFEPPTASTDDEHPQCRFPARFDWLSEQLDFPADLPHVTCDRFESWRDKLDADGVSLIFASYYMNNPSSMYGHTFLRLKRKHKPVDERLLDYTINFSANTSSSNGLAVAVLGLTGGYPGVFSTTPYYMKIQKYNNMESRDLWEYYLNFTPEQVDRLVKHVWELGHTSISYYFLTKNCSYQLLPVLEVANPDLHLTDQFVTRAIPLDTLRAVLSAPQLLLSSDVRPSHLEKMRVIRDRLTKQEQILVQDSIDKKNIEPLKHPSLHSSGRDIFILDGAQQYLRYKYGFKRPQPDDIENLEYQLQLLRSQIPEAETDISTATIDIHLNPPESAHGTTRVSLSMGVTKKQSFEEYSWRPALHDMNSDVHGFIPNSTLEMFGADVRYNNQLGKAYLEQATLIHVRSLVPWEMWSHKPSWAVKADFSTAHDLERSPQNTIHFNLSGGTGLSFPIPHLKSGIVYSMLDVDSGYGGIFTQGYRAGMGGTVGILVSAMERSRTHLSASYVQYGLGESSHVNKLNFIQSFSITKNTEIRITAERQNNYREIISSILFFY